MKATLAFAMLAIAAPFAAADSTADFAAKCVANRAKLEADSQYIKYSTANVGCYDPMKPSSHDCKTNLDDLKAACKRVDGWVCPYTLKYTNASLPADTRNIKQTKYVCTPQHCPTPDAYVETVALQKAGMAGASVENNCWQETQQIKAAESGGDLIFHLIFWGATLCFAASEKQRRAARTATFWPATGGTAPLRTSLSECCGCSRLCWSAACCCTVMTSMNRAELDKRQWAWYDCCCMANAAHCVAWHNRQAIRTRLNAKEDLCMDCVSLCFCPCCFVGQNTLEIEKGVPDAPATSGLAGHVPAAGTAVQMVAPTAVAMGAPLPAQGYPPASGGYAAPATSAAPVPGGYAPAAYGGSYPPPAGASTPSV